MSVCVGESLECLDCQTSVRNVLEMIVPVSVTAITHRSPGWVLTSSSPGSSPGSSSGPSTPPLTLGDGQTRQARIGRIGLSRINTNQAI